MKNWTPKFAPRIQLYLLYFRSSCFSLKLLYEAGVAKITIVEELTDSEWTKEEIVDLAQDTVTLINNEIDAIEEVEDKPRMKKLIKDLYMESLSI